MGTIYTVGAKIIINYDQSEVQSAVKRLENFIKSNPITIDKIKIDSGALNNIKSNLEKLSIKLDNVAINNIKIPSSMTKELKSKIESISFNLGNLKLDTSKIDGKKINLTLAVPTSEITKLKEQIEGLRPIIRVQVQGQNQVATPGTGSLAQASTFMNNLTSSGKYAGNTVISYELNEAGKLIAVLKNAQNETIRLKYQFDEASRSFQQIGASTKVPDLLNQSTAAAQRTFADLRNITTQFNVLKQQAGNNPIDFKTAKLIPDLELLNTKLRTLSTGMQQVTQVYKLNETQSISASGNYNMLRGQMDSLSTSTGNLINRQIGLGEAMSVAFQRFPLWIVVSTAVMGAVHKISEAFTFMSEQSKLFTNLQLEMTNTNLVFGEITQTANEFATEMGATTQTVMKAIAVFGTYTSTIEDVLIKSRSAVTLSSITGQGIEQTSDELMGVMTQYGIAADGIEGITDSILGAARMLQLDFPKGVAEISTGLRTVGSVAKDAGMNVATTTGILSTMIEVTRRSGSENSNALRTIISRISNVGEESDPEQFKGIEKKFSAIGVAIKSSSDTIRPMGDILKDLSEKWKILNDVERQSIAQAAAGVYRRNAFVSLMSNYDKVLQNTTAAEDSEGVTMQKQEIYSNSLAASVERLTAAWEKFYLNAINTSTWKSLVQGLTVVIDGFANFAGVVGGIPAVLSVLILSISLLSVKFRTFMSGLLGFTALSSFITSIKATQAAMLSFSGTSMSLGRIALARLTTQFNTLSASAIASAIATRALGVALSIGLATATLGISLVLSLTIGKLIEFADNIVHAKEKAKEAFKELTTSISTLKSETAQADPLIQSYEELSSKVFKTAEEKQKLADITSKLTSLFPSAVSGYDAEGNTILGNVELLKQLNAQKEEELRLKQQSLGDSFKATGSSSFTQIQSNEKTLNGYLEQRKTLLASISDIKSGKSEDMSISPDGQVIDNLSNYSNQLISLDAKINKLQPETQELITNFVDMAFAFGQTDSSLKNLDKGTLYNFSVSLAKSGVSINDFYDKLMLLGQSGIADDIKNEQTALDDMAKSGKTSVEIQTQLSQKINNEFIPALVKTGMTADDARVFLEKLFNLPPAQTESSINSLSTSTDEMISSMKDASSEIAELNTLQRDLAEGKELDGKAIMDLVDKYPQLLNAISVENGMLTINGQAISDLRDLKIASAQDSINAKIQEVNAEASALRIKLSNYGLEEEALSSLAIAHIRTAQIVNDITGGGDGMIGAHLSANIGGAVDKYFDLLNSVGNLNKLKSMVGASNFGVSASSSSGSSSSKTADPSYSDPTDAIVNAINLQNQLTKAKNENLKAEIAQAKTSGDYNLEQKKTNELIANQILEQQQLTQANNQLRSQIGNQAELRDWVDANGDLTSEYYRVFNSSSAEAQKNLSAEASKLQAIQKAIKSNIDAISSLNAEILSERNSEADSIIELYKKAYETQKDLALKNEDLRHNKVMDHIDAEIAKLDEKAEKENYDKSLSKSQSEVQKIQSKINELSIDDSIETKAKIEVLRQEMAEKQEAILETQNQHELDLRKANLEDQKTKESEKSEASKESIENIYTELINNEKTWADMRQNIISGNIATIKAELTQFATDFAQINKAKAEEIGVSFNELLSLIKQVNAASSGISSTSVETSTPANPTPPNNPTPPTPASTPISTTSRGKVHDVSSQLNVRNAPNGSVIGALFPNEEMEILGQNGNWYNVRYDTAKGKKVGWASSNYIQKFHSGGIVGNVTGSPIQDLVNKFFNTSPNETVIKSLLGEIQVPPQNIMKNFVPNMQNLVNMVTLRTPASASGVNINFNIANLNNTTIQEAQNFASKIRNELSKKGIR